MSELPLLGRDAELQRLEALVAGRAGGLLALTGEAGIGKTRLLNRALDLARSAGWATAVGTCPGERETPPLGPWRAVLGDYAAATGVALASLAAPFGERGRPESLFEVALDVADLLAAGPGALIGIEDLHWADADSLDLLRYAAPRLVRGRALVIMTYRPPQVDRAAAFSRLLLALLRAGAERMELKRLSALDVAALTEAAGYAGPKHEIYARSEGNPFFVRELLERTDGRLPETVQQAIGLRLSAIAPEQTEPLRVAALLGPRFDLAMLASVLDRPEEEVLGVVEAAVEQRLIREDGDGFAFEHTLVREALYRGLIGPRRKRWHRRAAAASVDPDVVAYHLGRAGDPSAVPHLRQAGYRSLRMGARLQAREYFERALELTAAGAPGRAELLLLSAHATAATDFRRSCALTDDASRTAEDEHDDVVAALALYQRGLQLHERLDGGAVEAMERAHASLCRLHGDDRLPALREVILGPVENRPGCPGALASVYLWSGRAADAQGLVAATPPVTATDHVVRAMIAMAARPRGELDRAIEHYGAAVEADVRAQRYIDATDHLVSMLQFVLLHRATDRAAVERVVARLADTAHLAVERTGRDPLGGRSPLLGLWIRSGAWDIARREVDAARAAGLRPGDRQVGYHRWLGVVLDCEQGDFERARRLAAAQLPPGGPGSAPPYRSYVATMAMMTTAARICRLVDDLDQARAWLETLDAWHAGPRPCFFNRGFTLLEWAEWHLATGDAKAGREAAAAALALGSSQRSSGVLMGAHRVLGRLGGTGAEHHFATALDLARRAGQPYEEALTEMARGRPEDIERARRTLQRLHARPALARCEALQRRLGEPGPASLTPREWAVARQIAEGLTDREAGDRLGISPRTVDAHLQNIFRKLDLPSRAALAAWVVRQGGGSRSS